MKKLTIVAIALAAVAVASIAGAAGPLDLSGHYKIKKGLRPDKKKYAGEVDIALWGSQTIADAGQTPAYSVRWTTTAGETYAGNGLQVGKELYVGYGGMSYGAGYYEAGTTMDGMPGVEYNDSYQGGGLVPTHVAANVKPGKWVGDWSLLDELNNPVGSVKIAKQGKAFSVVWTIGDRTVTGVGLASGKKLAVAWSNDPSQVGIAVYKLSGKSLNGTWFGAGATKPGTENLGK